MILKSTHLFKKSLRRKSQCLLKIFYLFIIDEIELIILEEQIYKNFKRVEPVNKIPVKILLRNAQIEVTCSLRKSKSSCANSANIFQHDLRKILLKK